MYQMDKKLLRRQICYFLGGKFLWGYVLKGQRVILFKWEDFGAFYPDFLCGKTS
jgi:hypothetical protein